MSYRNPQTSENVDSLLEAVVEVKHINVFKRKLAADMKEKGIEGKRRGNWEDWRRQKGISVFIKTPLSAYGCVGVLSYMFDDQQISLPFSNPLDQLKYNVEYALYTPDQKTPTDEVLYNNMYYHLSETKSFTKASLGRGNVALQIVTDQMEVTATM
uniref:Uncharacterized protein n=1 Tax=Callorhinchus milii TaxID=7868 RepID=A0A4W3GMU2_CALMI